MENLGDFIVKAFFGVLLLGALPLLFAGIGWVCGLVHGLAWWVVTSVIAKAKRLLLVGFAVFGLVGCHTGPDNTPDAGADAGPQACAVANSDVVAYQDCKTKTADGFECLTGCGRLPDDGGTGSLLGDGCTVQIGTSTPVTGICVSSCSVCQ